MGSTRDQMLDLDAERFERWMTEHYPGVERDTDEWDQVSFLYYWEQEALQDPAEKSHEQNVFVASLDNVHQRYMHANRELKKLYALLDDEQPELVYRMSFVHAVTVMEAYLMYCARALLEHDWPLKRFRDAYYLKSNTKRIKNTDKQAAREMSLSLFRPAARNYVSGMTFHNVKTIERYFGTVLHIPPIWPLKPLAIISGWRNDLVHRNGVDEQDMPIDITPQLLQHALQKVFELIDVADTSMRQEVDLFGDGRTEENREIIASALNIPPAGEAF